jgi:hypothetical protein
MSIRIAATVEFQIDGLVNCVAEKGVLAMNWMTYWIQQDISCVISLLRYYTGLSDEYPYCGVT